MSDKFVATAKKDNSIIIISRPCSRYIANQFKGTELSGETFKVLAHKYLLTNINKLKIIGKEYL